MAALRGSALGVPSGQCGQGSGVHAPSLTVTVRRPGAMTMSLAYPSPIATIVMHPRTYP